MTRTNNTQPKPAPKDKAMTARAPASEAARKHRTEIAALLERITSGLLENRSSHNATWGDAGDLDHYRARLQEISDSLHNEGEYAN